MNDDVEVSVTFLMGRNKYNPVNMFLFVCLMVLNAIFNNILIIL